MQRRSVASGTPVLIVDPVTPIVALAHRQAVTNFSDERRFSARSGENFHTSVLFLQPGDVVSLEFSYMTYRSDGSIKAEESQNTGATHETHGSDNWLAESQMTAPGLVR